jgi:beta-glucosidase
MTVAQTWDPVLMQQWGAAMGAEQRGKGSNVMLGPAVALVRVPWGGRNFEYLSEDPQLNSVLAASLVAGIQSSNISACVKHFIFNSAEANRTTMSANVAEGVGRELYLPPYAAAVDAGVGSVMCSFQRINGTFSCANGHWLTEVLKGELGFDGL